MPSKKARASEEAPRPTIETARGINDNIAEPGKKVQEPPSLEAYPHGCLCRRKQRSRIIARVPGPCLPALGTFRHLVSIRRHASLSCCSLGQCCCPPRSSRCPRLRRPLLFDPRESQRNCCEVYSFLEDTSGQNTVTPSRPPAGCRGRLGLNAEYVRRRTVVRLCRKP